MQCDINKAVEALTNACKAEYDRGVKDGYNLGLGKALPPETLKKYRLLYVEFKESGDMETAGIIDALLKDLQSSIKPEELSVEEVRRIWANQFGSGKAPDILGQHHAIHKQPE